MDPPSSVNPSHSGVQRANETSVPQSTGSPTGPSLSVFNNANNTSINNSSISTTINHNAISGSSTAPSLDLLYKSVAPNAILNEGGRADEVRCYPGTREEVIGLVEKSIDAQDYGGPRMLWLSGPAGAGKSAIMQTIAERCEERGVPHANFFFFRADSSRADASAFVATLMHQIIQLYPSVGPPVAASLASNPLLFQMGLQKQFDALLHQAFPTAQDLSSTSRPLALLIDGLDECDSEHKTGQRQLLYALDSLLLRDGPGFRVVVASRVEPQISMAFKQLRSQVGSIFLDEKYRPNEDIRRFVTAEFDKIKSTHYLGCTLASDWPSALDVDGIVAKSSGQFIYAATVMRFIAHSSASPVLSLQKVRGIIPPNKNTPFAQLDAVYSYILENVDDVEAVKAIFAMVFLRQIDVEEIAYMLWAYLPRLSRAVIDSCISELTPLVNKNHRHKLEFFHASLPDFLKDQTRAGAYYIDLEMFCTAAIPSWWADKGLRNPGGYYLTAYAIEHMEKPTAKITAALMEYHDQRDMGLLRNLVSHLHRIYTPHDPQSLIKIMQAWLTDDPRLAAVFPRDLLQSIRAGNSHILPVGTQETSIYKRCVRFVGNGLYHVIGKGKSSKR